LWLILPYFKNYFQSKLESTQKNEAMVNLVLAALEAQATINSPFIGN
jgi:hypothetical protein